MAISNEFFNMVMEGFQENFTFSVGVAILVAITIFRREMSCNRCYVVEEESPSFAETDWNDKETELGCLLEGAGHFYSGAPLANLTLVPVVEGVLGAWPSSKLLLSTPDDVLDHVGSFCSGYPYTAHLLHTVEAEPKEQQPFIDDLPPDAQVHIMSFLHPKDIVKVSCVNRAARDLMDSESEASRSMWRAIWSRDFAWLVEKWEVGLRAMKRSGVSEIPHGKDFYFQFALSYMDFLLAGNNTTDCCLVGVGGHVYDLSLFLMSHPGSPETVMAHAGKDSSVRGLAWLSSFSPLLGLLLVSQSFKWSKTDCPIVMCGSGQGAAGSSRFMWSSSYKVHRYYSRKRLQIRFPSGNIYFPVGRKPKRGATTNCFVYETRTRKLQGIHKAP